MRGMETHSCFLKTWACQRQQEALREETRAWGRRLLIQGHSFIAKHEATKRTGLGSP